MSYVHLCCPSHSESKGWRHSVYTGALDCQVSHEHFGSHHQEQVKPALIGLCRDLRGIGAALGAFRLREQIVCPEGPTTLGPPKNTRPIGCEAMF